MMTGRAKPSSIHRFLTNRFHWLCQVTRFKAETSISLAQLYRFLEQISWETLKSLIYEYFQWNLEEEGNTEWNAVDGKALRGSPGQQLISFRGHQSQRIQAQRRIEGKKRSEITEVRALLEEYELWNRKITLDALHMNPITTAGIHQKGGSYLIQVKANQLELMTELGALALTSPALGWVDSVDKGHGRLEFRKASFFSLASVRFEGRWKNSGMQGLLVVERITEDLKTGKISQDTAFYVTNQSVNAPEDQQELFVAVRNHWGIESDHWIRDVTFQEDRVKVSDSNRSQILGLLRTLILSLFRKAKLQNMQKAIETFSDSPTRFKNFLSQVGFL